MLPTLTRWSTAEIQVLLILPLRSVSMAYHCIASFAWRPISSGLRDTLENGVVFPSQGTGAASSNTARMSLSSPFPGAIHFVEHIAFLSQVVGHARPDIPGHTK